ncbi:hypothetical protein [Aureimonas leprariae]|uniref:Lipoprotein n=1 Tax=Plantimonas leprariae TaxID=2615207 RepID=A0A7V7TY76_9HYPH|nr:hypothetical protein [Aureimonas leprariae]KAB0682026.1 hypothetical protein F6X38_04270 [Aureimonas leprariae]
MNLRSILMAASLGVTSFTLSACVDDGYRRGYYDDHRRIYRDDYDRGYRRSEYYNGRRPYYRPRYQSRPRYLGRTPFRVDSRGRLTR